MLRDRRERAARRALPRGDTGAAHPPRGEAGRKAGGRGGAPLRALRHHEPHGRERAHVPASGRAAGVTARAGGPLRGRRSLRPCLAHVLHARAAAPRDLLRRVPGPFARGRRRDARALHALGHRRGRERAHAAGLPRARDGDVVHLGGHRSGARGASRRRPQRPPGEHARHRRLRATRLRHPRALHRGAGRTPGRVGAAVRRLEGEEAMTIEVSDMGLAGAGARRIEWAAREMPVLASIRERFAKDRPLRDLRVGACLHVTAETANLMLVLRDGGAGVALCASNPLSTQDDVAAALVANEGIATFARKGEDRDSYYSHINAVLATKPQIAVVAGYGWVGRGIASRLRGMGSIVLVCEVAPLRALEAAMDGFEVTTMAAAAARGDLFVTATGNVNVIGCDAIGALKDGAILANAGHFNDEIDLRALGEQAADRRGLRPFVEEYRLRDGRRVVVLGEGRLVNLAAAEGHPPAGMDMAVANRALPAERLVARGRTLKREVYPVPRELDEDIARRKLAA